MEPDYLHDADEVAASHPQLGQKLKEFVTLEHVFRWLRTDDAPDVGAIETVAQDEFSHDMIFELRSTGEYLVFGAT